MRQVTPRRQSDNAVFDASTVGWATGCPPPFYSGDTKQVFPSAPRHRRKRAPMTLLRFILFLSSCTARSSSTLESNDVTNMKKNELLPLPGTWYYFLLITITTHRISGKHIASRKVVPGTSKYKSMMKKNDSRRHVPSFSPHEYKVL